MSKLGYWLVEPLVEEGEYYPRGGMRRLVCVQIFPSVADDLYALSRKKVCSG